MTADDVRMVLRDECALVGGQGRWASAHSLSAQYVADVLAARRQPGMGILVALGLERVVTYRPLQTTTKPEEQTWT